jgi:hypothetical protein
MANPLTQSTQDISKMQAQGFNPLDDFQTFNNLFTLAGCTKAQIQGNISKPSIENIVCRSQSIGPDGGFDSGFGKFDYFIDDVIIATTPRPSKQTANTFATKISFKVFEPYSMGLFMMSMREAATRAGYELNFKEAPFIFMIEWIGYKDSKPGKPDEKLTRILPIKITQMKFKVGTTGSTYDIEAIPYNEFAFRDQVVKNVSDIQISGKSVEEMLIKGPQSLFSQLEIRYKEAKEKYNHEFDQILISFPKDFTATGGVENDISKAFIYEDFNNSGSQPFPNLNDPNVFDQEKQIYKSAPFKLEADRAWHFTQEISIPDIINEVIIRSRYITDQFTKDNQLKTDEYGMVKWFRIETRITDGEDVPELGRHKRLITYRVLPYKVHCHRFLPPGKKPNVGFEKLKNSVARVYDYIYTGKNTEILNLELNFDMAFFTVVPADVATNPGQSNAGQKGITAGSQEPDQVINPGIRPLPTMATGQLLPANAMDVMNSLTTRSTGQQAQNQQDKKLEEKAEMLAVQTPVGQRAAQYVPPGGGGTDTRDTSKVRTMQILLTNPGDMVNLNMDIMGDPYYIPTSGMGSQAVQPKGEQELEDGSMNYQTSETIILVNFRTPTDFDPKTGLYKFSQGIDMWSGLYQLTDIESRFNQNKFTQTIKGYRIRQQLGGENADTIFIKEQQKQQNGQGQPNGGAGDQQQQGDQQGAPDAQDGSTPVSPAQDAAAAPDVSPTSYPVPGAPLTGAGAVGLTTVFDGQMFRQYPNQ